MSLGVTGWAGLCEDQVDQRGAVWGKLEVVRCAYSTLDHGAVGVWVLFEVQLVLLWDFSLADYRYGKQGN